MCCAIIFLMRRRAEPYAALLDHAVTNAAAQAAAMMAAGFVHGVLNTDNINITGESFDYGPYRFAPTFDPAFTAAYFDHHRAVRLWPPARGAAVERLPAGAGAAVDRADRGARAGVETVPSALCAALTARAAARLGVRPYGDGRARLMAAMVAALVATGMPLDRFWFDWRGGALRPAGGRRDL